MNAEELSQIEQVLNLSLPRFYCDYMLNYPAWLSGKSPGLSDEVEAWEFANSAASVIQFNQYVRECDEAGEWFDDHPWPTHYFVIGSENEQNFYFLDLKSMKETVFLYHHEMGDVWVAADSLDQFPDALMEWWAGIDP